MKEYRTIEQYNEIVDSVINGNWTTAFRECVEYGFYANDLIRFYEEEEYNHLPVMDLVLLAEGACERRAKWNF